MLNYIWAGLVILSLVFALTADLSDLRHDTYRNGQPVPLTLVLPGGYDRAAPRVAVTVRADSAAWSRFYGQPVAVAPAYPGELVQSASGMELHFAKDASLPEPLATIRDMTSERDNDLRGRVRLQAAPGDTVAAAEVVFPPVRFVKVVAITRAAIDFAKTAVTLALGLIGVMALWLGMLRIAEKAGLVQVIVRIFEPLLRPLFPEIPRGHPALGVIVLNLAANVLGLGNAATPMGIKAMEELQSLNPVKDTATNSMVMLLAINTASVQVVPPVLLVAIMGLQVNQLFFPILICTGLSLVVAIVAAKALGRLRGYRASDPMRAGARAEG
ncbi:MAG TPA: nucleoside recognition domain-containing protein [Gemmatimonadales bacterium]|nr:nucleoside recognition domain-containing protein [Gemmatimonadales bacterium]